MKRIGIISDTHSAWDDRFAIHFKDCDEIWHAGDIGCVDVIRRLEQVCPVVRAVHGNIDHGECKRYFPYYQDFTVEDVNVFMVHVGGYPGRYAPGVQQMIHDARARIFVSGHSHILKVMFDPKLDCLHINPGAAGYSGWQSKRTLVKLDIDGDTPKNLEVIELGKPREQTVPY